MKEKETEIQKLKEEYHLALSRISHEIRNPVTLINSSMQLMEAEHPEVAGIDLWSDMKKDMLFLRRLLDELSGYNNGEMIHPAVSLGNCFQRPFSVARSRDHIHRTACRKSSRDKRRSRKASSGCHQPSPKRF